MQPGFKEVLQFRERLIYVRGKLDFGTGPLFNKILAEPSQVPQMQDVNIPFGYKAGGIGHECFGNEEGIQFMSWSSGCYFSESWMSAEGSRYKPYSHAAQDIQQGCCHNLP